MNRWVEHEGRLYNLDRLTSIRMQVHENGAEIYLTTENDFQMLRFLKSKSAEEFYETVKQLLVRPYGCEDKEATEKYQKNC